MKELLYTKEKDYWLDVQLSTTECDKCGVDLDPMKSIPVKVANDGYPEPMGFIFVCFQCKEAGRC